MRVERRLVGAGGDRDGRTGVGRPFGGGGEGSNVTVWTLSSATKAGVGAYLVAKSTTGEDALTVYVLDKDVPGSATSACDATCSKSGHHCS